MRHINFFLEAQNGGLWAGAKKFILKKHINCDPGRRVLRGRGLKVPHRVLFERFWAIASECPKKCFLSAFWRFLGLENAKKHSKNGALRGNCPKSLKKHSVGHFQRSCKWRPGSKVYVLFPSLNLVLAGTDLVNPNSLILI